MHCYIELEHGMSWLYTCTKTVMVWNCIHDNVMGEAATECKGQVEANRTNNLCIAIVIVIKYAIN